MHMSGTKGPKLSERLAKIQSRGFLDLEGLHPGPMPDEELVNHWEEITEQLDVIVSEPGYRPAFHRLVQEGCDRNHLSSTLLEKPITQKRPEDAESRKLGKNELKSLALALKRAAKLARGTAEKQADLEYVFLSPTLTVGVYGPPFLFRRMTGQGWLEHAAMRVEEYAEAHPLRLLFSPRDYDRFRLLRWVEGRTGSPHYKEVAELLSAKERTTVSEASLKKLLTIYRKNSRLWQKNPLHLRSKK